MFNCIQCLLSWQSLKWFLKGNLVLMYTHVSLGTPFAGLVDVSLITALFFWLLTLTSCYLIAHPCIHSTPVMPPSYCSLGLHLHWYHQAHLCWAQALHPFLWTLHLCTTFLVTSSLIPDLPAFRFLFACSWHRLHLLHLQLSLSIPSHVYLQDEESQISLSWSHPAAVLQIPLLPVLLW